MIEVLWSIYLIVAVVCFVGTVIVWAPEGVEAFSYTEAFVESAVWPLTLIFLILLVFFILLDNLFKGGNNG